MSAVGRSNSTSADARRAAPLERAIADPALSLLEKDTVAELGRIFADLGYADPQQLCAEVDEKLRKEVNDKKIVTAEDLIAATDNILSTLVEKADRAVAEAASALLGTQPVAPTEGPEIGRAHV